MTVRGCAARGRRAGRAFLWAAAIVAGVGPNGRAAEAPADAKRAMGLELFGREWVANDERSHGGDGLGPVYNDTSCIACHNAGGPGGGGPISKNVDILSAAAFQAGVPFQAGSSEPGRDRYLRRAAADLLGIERPRAKTKPEPAKIDTTELIRAHAGFRTARSVVLHKFGTPADYPSWRSTLSGGHSFIELSTMPAGAPQAARAQAEMAQIKLESQLRNNGDRGQTQVGPFLLTRSQRNPTALFGAGLLDAIPDAVLEAAAKAEHPGSSEVRGRVSRLKGGKIGRFGWKGQTVGLEDFVMTACAVELGLEVPGHSQGGSPQDPHARAKGLDLTAEQCDAMVAYVRSLPRPVEGAPSGDRGRRDLDAGKHQFAAIGCAACHSPKLGDVEGAYSDLLLHDLGSDLGDTGQYGVFVPDTSDPEFVDPNQPLTLATATVVTTPAGPSAGGKRPTGPAGRQEWRTPPLWGLRDSGPYLHDGRADTVEQAIALHGGEAEPSAIKYFSLSTAERAQLQSFLKSLIAPIDPSKLAAK